MLLSFPVQLGPLLSSLLYRRLAHFKIVLGPLLGYLFSLMTKLLFPLLRSSLKLLWTSLRQLLQPSYLHPSSYLPRRDVFSTGAWPSREFNNPGTFPCHITLIKLVFPHLEKKSLAFVKPGDDGLRPSLIHLSLA
ncbi:hypothetical protein M9H77_06662 [Catharanthus roseus]|uniref:Uncharacterized protein n=1 Tax=Catharanthus roseus TaxID=4058 RepID=A0ACC0BSR0_CATRO|nr:hypothetical protein M9H77_06662 [Catharanthus roseus]